MMRRHVFAATAVAIAATLASASQTTAEGTYDFLYTTTTDPLYNHRVHLLNTGVFVNAGETVTVRGEPVPLDAESVLFSQDRNSVSDHHDLDISITAQTDGYIYIGLTDEYFEDNSGSHIFELSITPEPASLTLLGLGGLALSRRRRVSTKRRSSLHNPES